MSDNGNATKADRSAQRYSFSVSLIGRFLLFLALVAMVIGLFGYAAFTSKDAQLDKASTEISELRTAIQANQLSTECVRNASAHQSAARDAVDRALDGILAETLADPRDPAKIREAADVYRAAVANQTKAVEAYTAALKGC
jgi:hypothetical protein